MELCSFQWWDGGWGNETLCSRQLTRDRGTEGYHMLGIFIISADDVMTFHFVGCIISYALHVYNICGGCHSAFRMHSPKERK